MKPLALLVWDWDLNLGLTLAKQLPYHLSHFSSPEIHYFLQFNIG
jgi:hypothetical protein